MKTQSVYERLPRPLQDLACTWAGRQRYRARFTPHFERTLAQLESHEGASLATLHAYQQGRLVELVNRARLNVPHYRAQDLPVFDSGDDPAKGLREILDAFPVLEKQAYRNAPESFLAEDIPADRRLSGKTSGTTGSALPLWSVSYTHLTLPTICSV